MFALQDHRSPSAQTSPPINWSDHLVHGLRRRPVDRTNHRLRRGLLSAQSSPATPGTPRSSVLGHRQRRWGLPYCSDLAMSHQCAIKLLHAIRIRVLILGSTSGVLIHACQTMSASFYTSCSLTLLQDSFFIFQQARGLSAHTSPYGECVLFDSGLRPWTGCPLGRSSAFLLLSNPGTT